MKKILSFVLVLAMIASMMCISVSAATCDQTSNAHVRGYEVTLTEKQKLDHVVGKRGHTGTNTDGAESANGTTDAMPIQASVSGETKNRYAVDLVYTAKTIAIGGDVTWNVNTLKYDGTKTINIGNAAQDTDLVNGQKVTNVGEFKVTNYSNEKVTVSAAVVNCPDSEGNANKDGVNIVTDITVSNENYADGGASILTAKDEIAGVVPQVDAAGTAVVAYYQAEMNCEDWAANLWNVSGQFVIASITFTIAPVAAQGTN